MELVTLESAKLYLRVDSADEDALISILLSSSMIIVRDVARMTASEWNNMIEFNSEDEDAELTIRDYTYSNLEATQLRELIRTATLYALGYLFEHREAADYHDLTMTLGYLLFAVREGAF